MSVETTTAPTTEAAAATEPTAPTKPKKGKKGAALPFTFQTVPTADLVVGVNHGRGGYTADEWEAGIDALAAGIKAFGQQEPILAREEGGKLIVVDGHRRLAACEKLGIPVQVLVNPNLTTETAAKIASIIANVHEKPTDLQEALIVEDLLAEKWSLTEVSKLFGRTNTNRTAALVKLLKAGEALRTLVHEGKVSLSAANQVAGDAKAEEKLVADVKAGKSVTAVDAAGLGDTGEDTDDGEEKPKPQPKKNVKHLTEFVDGLDEETTPDAVTGLLQAVIKFLKGGTDQVLKNAIKKHFGK